MQLLSNVLHCKDVCVYMSYYAKITKVLLKLSEDVDKDRTNVIVQHCLKMGRSIILFILMVSTEVSWRNIL